MSFTKETPDKVIDQETVHGTVAQRQSQRGFVFFETSRDHQVTITWLWFPRALKSFFVRCFSIKVSGFAFVSKRPLLRYSFSKFDTNVSALSVQYRSHSDIIRSPQARSKTKITGGAQQICQAKRPLPHPAVGTWESQVARRRQHGEHRGNRVINHLKTSTTQKQRQKKNRTILTYKFFEESNSISKSAVYWMVLH